MTNNCLKFLLLLGTVFLVLAISSFITFVAVEAQEIESITSIGHCDDSGCWTSNRLVLYQPFVNDSIVEFKARDAQGDFTFKLRLINPDVMTHVNYKHTIHPSSVVTRAGGTCWPAGQCYFSDLCASTWGARCCQGTVQTTHMCGLGVEGSICHEQELQGNSNNVYEIFEIDHGRSQNQGFLQIEGRSVLQVPIGGTPSVGGYNLTFHLNEVIDPQFADDFLVVSEGYCGANSANLRAGLDYMKLKKEKKDSPSVDVDDDGIIEIFSGGEDPFPVSISAPEPSMAPQMTPKIIPRVHFCDTRLSHNCIGRMYEDKFTSVAYCEPVETFVEWGEGSVIASTYPRVVYNTNEIDFIENDQFNLEHLSTSVICIGNEYVLHTLPDGLHATRYTIDIPEVFLYELTESTVFRLMEAACVVEVGASRGECKVKISCVGAGVGLLYVRDGEQNQRNVGCVALQEISIAYYSDGSLSTTLCVRSSDYNTTCLDSDIEYAGTEVPDEIINNSTSGNGTQGTGIHFFDQSNSVLTDLTNLQSIFLAVGILLSISSVVMFSTALICWLSSGPRVGYKPVVKTAA